MSNLPAGHTKHSQTRGTTQPAGWNYSGGEPVFPLAIIASHGPWPASPLTELGCELKLLVPAPLSAALNTNAWGGFKLHNPTVTIRK